MSEVMKRIDKRKNKNKEKKEQRGVLEVIMNDWGLNYCVWIGSVQIIM